MNSIGEISHRLNKCQLIANTPAKILFAHACTSARNTVQQLLSKTLLTSFLLSSRPNRPELNSIDYKLYGVYSSVNIS